MEELPVEDSFDEFWIGSLKLWFGSMNSWTNSMNSRVHFDKFDEGNAQSVWASLPRARLSATTEKAMDHPPFVGVATWHGSAMCQKGPLR